MMVIDEQALATSALNSPADIRPLQEFLIFFQEEIDVLKAEYGCHILNLDQVDEEFGSLAACHGIVKVLDQVVGRSKAILAVVAREFPHG